MFGLVGRFRTVSEKEVPSNEVLDHPVILVDVPGGRIHMKTLNMKLSDELYDALKEAARAHGLPMAELVRIALRKYVLADASSEEDVLTLKDLSKAISDLRAHLSRLEEENAELRQLLSHSSSGSSRVKSVSGGLGSDETGRIFSRGAVTLPSNVSSKEVTQGIHNRDEPRGGGGTIVGSYGLGSTGVRRGSGSSRRHGKGGSGVYEELALEVMSREPSREWGIKELFEEVMRGRGRVLEEQGVVLNPDSFKDRVIRMAKKGVIRKVSRGKYSLA